MIDAAVSWIDGQDRFSDAEAQISQEVRDDFDLPLAMSLLESAIRHALDPKRCDRLGLSRHEAVRQSVDLWCSRALRPQVAPD
jgi:hypothetical protein